MRAAMGADAVAAARAVGYVGAGTVEFIVDAQLKHYFLEMNTRLQVEHPVTEAITGLDLVEWQLRVAAGEALPLTQDQVQFTGHAIQARLYAEDPYDHWKPQTGRILGWQAHKSSLRIDHGITAGQDITPYYDAMVAKFIAHGRDREDAVRRLTHALEDVPLFGPLNNGRFLRDLLQHPQFHAAQMTTTGLDDGDASGTEALLQRPHAPDWAWRVAAAMFANSAGDRPASVAGVSLTMQCNGQTRTLRAPVSGVQVLALADQHLRVVVDGVQRSLPTVHDGDTLHLALQGALFSFTETSPYPSTAQPLDHRRARSPVAGVVAQVAVAVGDTVAAGQPLLCVEAMKMEMWLHAGAAGTVQALHAKAKDSVAKGAVLVELQLHEPPLDGQAAP
jgi:geranyl-CoA carboxylase alpha subunit